MIEPTESIAAVPRGGTTRGLLLALAGIAAIVAAVAVCYRPPAPEPVSASVARFSAARALDVLRPVLAEGVPHPVGSAANAVVRDRLIDQLRALGYEPEIQRGFSCDEWGACGAVENIVSRLAGREPGQAVALVAHYDSVAAGPGASDDGAGVAALLEIARALRVHPVPRHSIILLITDGEELGLLGARVFIDEHPWARQVRAAVNLEARGTSGPSFLFETGSANRWAMKLYDGRVPTPITNSIYYTAYKLLPNDTDFTVFKTRDWQGYNFAFTGDVQHYHTPLDNLANVSAASLQHHGDNGLAMLIALANADVPAPVPNGARPESAESVYVDVFAAGLLRWPVTFALPAAVVTALLWLVAVVVLQRRKRLRLGAAAIALVATIIALALAVAASIGMLAVLRALGALPPAAAGYAWLARPLPVEIANSAVALGVVVVIASAASRRAGFWGLWTAAGLLLQLAGLASAVWLPGLSFAMLLPALALLVTLLPALLSREDSASTRTLAAIGPGLVSTAALLPTLWFLYPTLGLYLLPAVALLVVWMLLMLMPLIAGAARGMQIGLLIVVAGVGIAATAVASQQPVYTEDSPQRLNFEYWLDADSGKAEWHALPDSGALPTAVQAAAAFALRDAPLLPWHGRKVWQAEAPPLELAPPQFEILSHEAAASGVRYTARLRSARGASMASVCFAPNAGVSAFVIGGYAMPAESERVRSVIESRRRGWRCYEDDTMAPDGVMLSFELAAKGPVELIVLDRSDGLPAAGDKLLKARPANATRSQDGDVTKVVRRMRIEVPDSGTP